MHIKLVLSNGEKICCYTIKILWNFYGEFIIFCDIPIIMDFFGRSNICQTIETKIFNRFYTDLGKNRKLNDTKQCLHQLKYKLEICIQKFVILGIVYLKSLFDLVC